MPNVLTVLNYHRVDDSSIENAALYRPNISAAPQVFARQMDHMKQNYNVISCTHLAAALRGEVALKPYSALITFDDGYYDNLSKACPILVERGLPATIFLATDFIDAKKIYYWDYAAYCFFMTERTSAALPVIGEVSWTDEDSRDRVMNHWIRIIKSLPDTEKKAAVAELPESLAVTVTEDAFEHLYLTWDQVRELTTKGIEMGAHTVAHPILTKIPLSQAAEELTRSKQKIEAEIGGPIISFAYPNGQKEDFSPEVVDLVKASGFEVAFTLLPGPIRYSTVKKSPLLIRRIFVGQSDTYARFIAKLLGFEILVNMLQRFRQ